MKMITKNSTKGFTLIELLVVIFIIGILASVILANVLGARQRAEDLERKSNAQEMKKALRLYYNDNQSYPESGNFPAENTAFTDSSEQTVYMGLVPEDLTYYVSDDGEEFRLIVTLDNLSDSDIADSQTRCPNTGNFDSLSYADGTYVVCEY